MQQLHNLKNKQHVCNVNLNRRNMKLRIKLRVKQLKFQIYFHNIQVSYLLHIIWKQILLNYSTSSTPSMIEISFRGSQKDCDGGIKLHSNVFDTFVLKFDTHEN